MALAKIIATTCLIHIRCCLHSPTSAQMATFVMRASLRNGVGTRGVCIKPKGRCITAVPTCDGAKNVDGAQSWSSGNNMFIQRLVLNNDTHIIDTGSAWPRMQVNVTTPLTCWRATVCTARYTGGFCHNICLYYQMFHNYALKHPIRHISDTCDRFVP